VTKVRCRFAPSPTGHLHVGGARTALINWLYARHNDGEFVLRIEDTDPERSKQEFTDAILEGMRWLGLDWDGEPRYQSQRMDLYRREALRLVAEGKAYYCSCTAEEVEAMREEAMKAGRKPKYDGRCRHRADHPPDRPQVIRFKAEDFGATRMDDLIMGGISFDNAELDDLIIVRGDGAPTYNFCVVVDDHDMGITHVIRGGDHINNTPRQIQLYNALGYELPHFAHHPLVLGKDKAKLSKRHGATSLVSYRDLGYLPRAMMNFLARIGWSHGDQEIFTRDELIELFTLEALGKSPGVWDEDKLNWINQQYIIKSAPAELAPLVAPFYLAKGLAAAPDAYLEGVIRLHQERVKTLTEFPETAAYYYTDEIAYDDKARAKFLTPDNRELLLAIKERFAGLAAFDEKSIEAVFTGLATERGVKLGAVAQPVRVAITGGTASPGLFEVVALLGKERTVRKLERAIAEPIRPGGTAENSLGL
jgi:glutamyl-tRNA synthetase